MLKSFLFLIFLTTTLPFEIVKPSSETNIKIAFGSGNKKNINDKSKIFYSVARFSPDVWIWLGKTINRKKN